jgi:hypothetical protein
LLILARDADCLDGLHVIFGPFTAVGERRGFGEEGIQFSEDASKTADFQIRTARSGCPRSWDRCRHLGWRRNLFFFRGVFDSRRW